MQTVRSSAALIADTAGVSTLRISKRVYVLMRAGVLPKARGRAVPRINHLQFASLFIAVMLASYTKPAEHIAARVLGMKAKETKYTFGEFFVHLFREGIEAFPDLELITDRAGAFSATMNFPRYGKFIFKETAFVDAGIKTCVIVSSESVAMLVREFNSEEPY